MNNIFQFPYRALVAITFTAMMATIGCTSIETEFLKVSQDLEISNEKIQGDTLVWAQKFAPIFADTSKDTYTRAYTGTNVYTNDVLGYMDNFIATLKDLEPSDHKTPTEVMIKQSNGDILANRIEFYREQVLSMPIWSEQDIKSLRDSLPLNTFYNQDNARKLKKKNWSAYHFEDVPVVAVITVLNKLKNDALRSREMVWERIYQKATGNKSPSNP